MSAPLYEPGSYGPTEALLFTDGLGDRVVSADGATGDLIQTLRISPALTAVPSFEFALRERVARLANFRHPSYGRVRRVDRAPSHATALSLVSDHEEGTRLSEILRVAHERRLHLDINAALCLVRQLLPAIAVLHENARDAAHGILAPERLVVTPNGRLVVAEHVFGSAIEQMQYGRERLWHELRVAMPPSAGIPRFDQRADVTAIGAIALALVLGRPLRSDEFPRGLHDLLQQARERTAVGDEAPLSAGLQWWLACALHLDARRAFASAPEALAAFDQLAAQNPAYVPAPVALETFLSRYIAAVLVVPSAPVPAPAPTPLPVERIAPPEVSAPRPISSPASLVDDDTAGLDLTEVLAEDAQESAFDRDPMFGPDASFTMPAAAEAAGAAPAKPRRRRGLLAALAVVVILASAGVAAYQLFAGDTTPALATLTIESNPSGVPVFVDGIERGVTPARLTLAAGAHIVELRRGVPRVIPLTLASGAEVSQYLEFAEAPLPEDTASAPVAAQPVPTPPVPAAEAPAAPLAGWISVRLPFAVEIREGGRLLGTTDVERLMLAAGRHDLEFVNAALGFRVSRTIHVPAGRVTNVPFELPKGTVHVNAVPWAEVWLNGERVGETPIGNLSVPIGAHELVFRHPQFGEKRHAVSVTLGQPVRVSVDMK